MTRYETPKTWADVARIKQQMQIDMLYRATSGAKNAKEAASRIGMDRSNFVNTCRRFGVPVDHLVDERWRRRR